MSVEPDLLNTVESPEEEAPVSYSNGTPVYAESDDKYASKTMAALTRAEWDDYKTRFQPYELQLKDIALNGDVGGQVDTALGLVDASFNTAAGKLDRGLEMYGAKQDQQTQAANSRGLSLAHAAARAGAENDVRLMHHDRQTEVMAGTQVGGMKSIAGDS